MSFLRPDNYREQESLTLIMQVRTCNNTFVRGATQDEQGSMPDEVPITIGTCSSGANP